MIYRLVFLNQIWECVNYNNCNCKKDTNIYVLQKSCAQEKYDDLKAVTDSRGCALDVIIFTDFFLYSSLLISLLISYIEY